MKPLSSAAKRFWVRLAYLMPAIVGLLLLIHSLVPHLYFIYEEELYQTMSSHRLMSNTWESCMAMLENESADQYVTFFSYIMVIFVVLSRLFALLYAIFAVLVTAMSIRAFSVSPTDRTANRSKRWLHLYCPNRVAYAVFGLLPLLPAFFPYLLSHFYRSRLGMEMKVFFFGPSDPLLAGVLILLLELSFFLTLRMQSETHLDLFRLYKKKPDEKK